MKRLLLLCALGVLLSGCEVARDYAEYDYTAVPTLGVDPATQGFVKVCNSQGLWCRWVRYGVPRTTQSHGTAVIIFTDR